MGLSNEEMTAMLLTLKVASVAVVCSLPLAVVVAYLLSRGRFPGKACWTALCICR